MSHDENNAATRLRFAVMMLERALPMVDGVKDAFDPMVRNALSLAAGSIRAAISIGKPESLYDFAKRGEPPRSSRETILEL